MPEFTKLLNRGKSEISKLKTEIIMPPAVTHYSSLDGHITDGRQHITGNEQSGAGVIVTEGAGCRKRGKFGRILINEDKYIRE